MMNEWIWIGGSAGSVIYFPACKTAPGWRQVLLIETRLSTFQMHFRCLAHVKTGRIGYAHLLLRSPLSPRQLSRAICCCGRLAVPRMRNIVLHTGPVSRTRTTKPRHPLPLSLRPGPAFASTSRCCTSAPPKSQVPSSSVLCSVIVEGDAHAPERRQLSPLR